MVKISLMKAMVCGLIVLLLGTGIVPGTLIIEKQSTPKTISDGGYPNIGSIAVYWGLNSGRYTIRPDICVGYLADRNFSFPVNNNKVTLGFIINCYIFTTTARFSIPRFSIYYAELRDHDGIVKGHKILFSSIQNKSVKETNLNLISKPIPAVAGGTGDFTIRMIGLSLFPTFRMNWITYSLWVTYT